MSTTQREEIEGDNFHRNDCISQQFDVLLSNHEDILHDIIIPVQECYELFSKQRDGNNIEEVRLLDKSLSALKKVLKAKKYASTSSHEQFAYALLTFMWSCRDNTKVNRKLFQIFCELEHGHEKITRLAFKNTCESISCTSTVSVLSLWGSLVAQSVSAKDFIRQNENSTLSNLIVLLTEALICTNWTAVHQLKLHAIIKIILGVEQVLIKEGHTVFNGSSDDGSCCQKEAWHAIVQLLLQTIQSKCVPKDGCLMAATALIWLLTTGLESSHFIQSVIELYSSLGTDSSITFGSQTFSLGERGVKYVQPGFGHLAIASGILAGCHKSLWMQHVQHFALHPSISPLLEYSHDASLDDPGTLLTWLFLAITDLCFAPDTLFHAMRLLAQWYQRVSKLLKDETVVQNLTLFKSSSFVTSRTLEVIFTHLDSPLEGVHEHMVDVFKVMLHLHLKHNKCSSGENDLVSKLLDQVTQMSWQIKGRHVLMAGIVPYLPTPQLVDALPELSEDMLRGLSTNYLAPAVTSLYQAVLVCLCKDCSDASVFYSVVMPALLEGLLSVDRLLCHNTCSYWLPVTFKILPKSFSVLVDAIEEKMKTFSGAERSQLLYGTIAVLKVARTNHICIKWPKCLVAEAFVNPEINLRLEAFSLVCVSPKKSDPLDAEELSMLYTHLPQNMNMDSPPFRQHLQTVLSRAVMRCRDGALALLSASPKPLTSTVQHTIDSVINFVDWLWTQCVDCLHPGANYQRMKTSLDIMMVVMETLTPRPDRRKGGCPASTTNLIKLAQCNDKWQFFCSKTTLTLLVCLMNGTDEVRNISQTLLSDYFPSPLNLHSSTKRTPDTVLILVKEALKLCSCCKARESESGATLMKVIFMRYVVVGGQQFSLCVEDGCAAWEPTHCEAEQQAVAAWLKLFCDTLEAGLSQAHSNVLVAAKNMPSHGVLLALHLWIEVCPKKLINADLWLPLIAQLICLIDDLIELVLKVFGGKIHEDENAPSFEQMSVAIQQTISEVDDQGVEQDNTVISPEHQIINTWCWLSIRASSLVLSQLVQKLSTTRAITTSQVYGIAATFFKVLTKCRHKGAIEGCNAGFQQLSMHLLHHSNAELCVIPGRLLDDVLQQLCSLSSSSVTRRSAGLPLIVQAIIASEAKSRQTTLLNRTISELLNIANQPLDMNCSQQQDHPQTHALNMLRAIFTDASVSQGVRSHIAPAVILALNGFSSPSWSIRNSATQLFGTLQARLIGQKKTRDDALHTTTAAEIFAEYPVLQPFLLSMLTNVTEAQTAGQLRLHPSLFPALSLLSKLAPGAALQEGGLAAFLPHVLSLAKCPIYAVRSLASEAVVAMVPKRKVLSFLINQVTKLPKSSEDCLSYNEVHGKLLQINHVLQHALKSDSSEFKENRAEIERLWRGLNGCGWLCTTACPLVGSVYLKLVCLMQQLSAQCCPDQQLSTQCCPDQLMEQQLTTQVLQIIKGCDSTKVQVGEQQYVEQIIGWWLYYIYNKPQHMEPGESVQDCVIQCLSCQTSAIRIATLHILQQWLAQHKEDVTFWSQCQNLILQRIYESPQQWEELCAGLQLTLDILAQYKYLQFDRNVDVALLWKQLMQLLHTQSNSRPAALALALSGEVLKQYAFKLLPECAVVEWSEALYHCCGTLGADLLRLCAARTLCTAGTTILKYCQACRTKSNIRALAHRILAVCLELLMDEDGEIRNTTAAFVNDLLPQQKINTIDYNTALQWLFEYMKQSWCSTELGDWMYNLLSGSSDRIVNNIQKHLTSRNDEVFESDEINPYREQIMLNQLIVNCLQTVPVVSPETAALWIQEEIERLNQQLQSVLHCVQQHSQSAVSVGLLSSRPVFEALHGLLCKLQVVHAQHPQPSTHTPLTCTIEMEQLHPFLWQLY